MVQNVFTVAKIVALAALILGGFVLWARLGAPPPVPNAPAPRDSLAAGARRGVRRRAVHHRRLAADEHGRRRDPGSGADDPARAGARHRDRGRDLPRRERGVPARVRPRRAGGEQRRRRGYGNADGRAGRRDVHHRRGDAVDPRLRERGDAGHVADLLRDGAGWRVPPGGGASASAIRLAAHLDR